MGDLLALLNDINSTEAEMEFCEDFNKLQLILNTTNQYVRSFDKIVFDSGNEPYIIEVVARLLKYLRIQNYLDAENKVNRQHEPELRRITMYLLLNTDVCFRYDLEQEPRVNHLLNSLPQLTKCLLLNCIWGLDLDRFFYEMLRYAPLWFSMQFIDQAIVSLKYGKPYEVLERIESMVSAIYFAMCRTDVDWRKINRNRYVDQQRTLGRLCDYVVEMLRYFNTPDASKFEGWSKLRKHRYFGFVLKHMFSMTMACLDLYFRKPAIPVDPAMSIYQLMDDQHVHKPAPDEYSQATEATLLKINHYLLNTLEFCIMHVSLERFCYWVEIDLFQEGEETVTLQQVIGEAAYRLCEDLKSHKHFRHSIVRHLTQFALRPKTLAEKATALNLGTLMTRIDGAGTNEERLVYLSEFLSRSERVFDNAECLETIEQHWRLLNGAHVRLMIEYDAREPVGDELEGEEEEELTEERAKLRELILRAVDVLPANEFHRLLTFTLDTFGEDFSRYERPDLVPSIIQLVNRLAETATGQPTVPNVQQLLFQSPFTFFEQLVRVLYMAGAGSSQGRLVDAVVAIIVRYKSIAKPYITPHVAAILTGQFELCRSPALISFANQLYTGGVFPSVEFLDQFLVKGLAEAYRTNNRPALYELMRLYGAICPGCWANDTNEDKYEKNEPKRQLMRTVADRFANIVQQMRYHLCVNENILEPEPDRMILVSVALEQLIVTLQQIHVQFSNEDKKEFLQNEELDMDDSTMYYFYQHLCVEPPPKEDGGSRDLTNGDADTMKEKKKQPPKRNEYDAFVYRCPLTPTSNEKDIISFITMMFPRCTQPEALAIARDKRFGSYIPAAGELGLMRIFTCSTHAGLMRHCMSNFIQCLLQVLLPADVERGRGTEACQTAVRIVLLQLTKFIPGRNREQARAALNGELAELYRYVRTVAPTVAELDKLKACLVEAEIMKEKVEVEQEDSMEEKTDEKLQEEEDNMEGKTKEDDVEDMDTSEKKEEKL
uniref:Uncharacterized protein n=1 Tax=Anopheles christyi TaxID=43041 RepID=A0A182JNX3_9DIPT